MHRVFAVALIAILGAGSLAFAEERPRISMITAISIATREVPGEVIEAELEDDVYEIKIRTEKGEKIKLKIDPNDGSILKKGLMMKDRSAGSFDKPQQ